MADPSRARRMMPIEDTFALPFQDDNMCEDSGRADDGQMMIWATVDRGFGLILDDDDDFCRSRC